MKKQGRDKKGFFVRAAVGMGTVMLAGFALEAFAAVPVAVINGKALDAEEVQQSLSALTPGQREQMLRDPQARKEVVRNMINQELLVQEGQKAKLDQDAEYKRAAELFRRSYLANKVLERNLGSKVTDAAAKRFYESNKIRYSPDRADVQHILLTSESEAKDLAAKAQAKDADFQALAEKHSKDPSAANNRGSIGVITRDGPFAPEFVRAAFDAPVGKVVGPIKTPFGFHLIKVVNKKLAAPAPYADVELRVKADLRASLVTEFIEGLRKTASVSIDEAALNKM